MCCGRLTRESSADEPILMGEPTGEPPVRVRATQNIPGILVHDVGWVTGSSVPALIDCRAIVVLDSPSG